jgi:translation initiation factor IF-1
MSGDKIQASGKVIREKGNGFFDVEIPTDVGVMIVLCQISGKIRQRDIKILVGDYVDIEIDPYNLKRGIIKFRRKMEDCNKNG